MGLFGAIASVANGFKLVPPGTPGGADSAAPASAADIAAVPSASSDLLPAVRLPGALRAQISAISVHKTTSAVRDDYLAELGALFAQGENAPDLGTSFDGFVKACRALAASPRDAERGREAVKAGETLAGTVRALAQGVEKLAERMGGDAAVGLQHLNQTLIAIHRENRTIATQAALNRPSDEDECRRDALVANVVEMTGANVFPRENRGVALYTANGQPLLDGRPYQFSSTASSDPAPAGAISADGSITDGRLGALLRLGADGSRATPPRMADCAPDGEILRKLRSQLDGVAATMLGRTRPKQPTTLADAYDMAPPASPTELGFGFFIGSNRANLQINPELLSGAKTTKPEAMPAVANSLCAGGRQFNADGLNLTAASYSQFVFRISDSWSKLCSGASRETKVADTASNLMSDYRQNGSAINFQTEVTGLATIQDALATSRRIAHSLGELLRTLDQVAA